MMTERYLLVTTHLIQEFSNKTKQPKKNPEVFFQSCELKAIYSGHSLIEQNFVWVMGSAKYGWKIDMTFFFDF